MTRKKRVSAGLLLFRDLPGGLEFFIAHPGGPFWRNRDEGAWTIPKGIVEDDEELLAAAIREFREETGIEPHGPYHALGSIKLKSGKIIHAWAWEGDADASSIRSNMALQEWPRGSGRWITYPEIDRCGWYSAADAMRLMNPAQAELIPRVELLRNGAQAPSVESADGR